MWNRGGWKEEVCVSRFFSSCSSERKVFMSSSEKNDSSHHLPTKLVTAFQPFIIIFYFFFLCHLSIGEKSLLRSLSIFSLVSQRQYSIYKTFCFFVSGLEVDERVNECEERRESVERVCL